MSPTLKNKITDNNDCHDDDDDTIYGTGSVDDGGNDIIKDELRSWMALHITGMIAIISIKSTNHHLYQKQSVSVLISVSNKHIPFSLLPSPPT